jgi:poly(A) polymerase
MNDGSPRPRTTRPKSRRKSPVRVEEISVDGHPETPSCPEVGSVGEAQAELDLPRFEVSDFPADFAPLELAPAEVSVEHAVRLAPEPVRYDVAFDEERIDSDAARVVRRLSRAGFEAFLVGGCVRDLLLGIRPKDFDVTTDASPDDVRRLFRNSRIIGRRFRLVHVLYGGGKVIETATFRRAPPQEDDRDGAELLIRNDNEFGEAHEDALRRDFTVNGLFYDLDARQVLDWVAGMPDIERRTINTIGDPVIRFQEDPIRILRAIKFAARLDCGIAPAVYDAIVQCRGSLAMAARPRLFEELLRLMRGGASHRSVFLAWETGVLDVLLPELGTFLSDDSESGGVVWRILQRVDALTKEQGAPLSDLVLCAALLLEPMLEACQNARDRMRAAGEFLEPLIDRLNVPRRIADALRRIVALLPRIEAGRGGRFQRTALFADAVTVQAIRLHAQAAASAALTVESKSEAEAEASAPARPRRRRRRTGANAVGLESDPAG